MGCDYYIYTALKIVHGGGVFFYISLSEKPVYLYGYDDDTDDFTTHPSERRPKIDHMKPENPDVLIYKKGDERINTRDLYLPKYMELVEEYIRYATDEDYKTTNKIILNNCIFGDHNMNLDGLSCKDEIEEMYIVELRAWRP